MDNLSKMLASNDKMLETISNKMESFSSAIKNQHSFNKMLESQISQLVSSVPTARARYRAWLDSLRLGSFELGSFSSLS
jgi:hypothetical protein